MDLRHFKNMFLHFSQNYQNRFQTSCHFRTTLECIYLGNEKIGQFHDINPILRAPFFSELDLKSRKSINLWYLRLYLVLILDIMVITYSGKYKSLVYWVIFQKLVREPQWWIENVWRLWQSTDTTFQPESVFVKILWSINCLT